MFKTDVDSKRLIYYGSVCVNIHDGSPNIVSRIYTYPRGLYRRYTAYIVLRLPCCCSGHNIIPTTHRRNEPFIAALLGCCFLSQANTTTSSSSPNRRPRSWRSRLLPFRASLFLLLAAHHAHTHTHYPRCVTLRYIALRCIYVPCRCTRRVAAPALGAAFAPRRVSRKFRGNPIRRH